jgi:hypothetical protein
MLASLLAKQDKTVLWPQAFASLHPGGHLPQPPVGVPRRRWGPSVAPLE